MSYKFLNASLPTKKTQKETFISEFQNVLDIDFKTSSDWFMIKKEYPYGSKIYQDIEVRINRLFDGKTTISVGDDYKRILFKKPEDSPKLGSLFEFDDNYWIVTNTEAIKSLATTCVVRRCNNMLRWKDNDTGVIYTEPCVIDYLIKESRDYSTGGSALVQPSGFIEVLAQFNDRTNLIRPSKRFIFGNPSNWNGYKIMGGGLNNFDNRLTSNNTSLGIIRMSMLANQINHTTDDLVNGIADVEEYYYSLSLDKNSLNITTSGTYKLIPTFEINQKIESGNYIWSSSDVTKATVDSNGVVTGVSPGSCTITCSLSNNSSITDNCLINVTSASNLNYSIVLSPNFDYVYEGEEKIFTTTLYLNNIPQPDVFTYTLNQNGVPTNNFRYNVLSGNTFWIKNIKRFKDAGLIIVASSGSNSINIPINLVGAW